MVFLLSSVSFSLLKGSVTSHLFALTFFFVHKCGLRVDMILFEDFCSFWWFLKPVFRMSDPFFLLLFIEYEVIL